MLMRVELLRFPRLSTKWCSSITAAPLSAPLRATTATISLAPPAGARKRAMCFAAERGRPWEREKLWLHCLRRRGGGSAHSTAHAQPTAFFSHETFFLISAPALHSEAEGRP
ncbi:uncharacterized protein K452DRAFT_104759 [Aplosporella prunicola CBS 121167]|uniref:Uncharacterized protein n=1 Tax=Aplosporella prunicola CBS 121167 TaxID=1176127 RepID=A0A6A6BPX1_9PEZI|nr:uncharacterized protein K452DRAFT_104759 [Aplosporella prunicola CBS 121167]KAF2146030.1 hypothetical protein K452DRAFT_104759 [Aplosporella prunicola CBS 121167]